MMMKRNMKQYILVSVHVVCKKSIYWQRFGYQI